MKSLKLLLFLATIFAVSTGYSTEFVKDTFTESGQGVNLANHTGEIGATWTSGYYGGLGIYDNRLICLGGYWGGDFVASGVPSSAEYDITAKLRWTGAGDSDFYLFSRWDNTLGGYEVRIRQGEIRLGRKNGDGTVTVMAETSYSWTLNQVYTVRLETRNAAKKVFVNNVEVLSGTDNAFTWAGRVRIWMMFDNSYSSGFQLDEISATDASSDPVPVVSGLSSTNGTVGVAFNASILASNSPSDYSTSGSLPPGLSLVNGVIVGTPTTAGSFNFNVSASNSAGSSSPVSVNVSIDPAPTGGTEFLKDTFTESGQGVNLANHTGEIGATWTSGYYGGLGIYDNRLICLGGYWGGDFVASGVPSSAEYDITAKLRWTGAGDSDFYLFSRWDNTLGGYEVRIRQGEIRLGRKNGDGTVTVMAETSYSWTLNQVYTVRLETRNAAKKVFVNNVEVLSGTDNAFTWAGRVRISMMFDFSYSSGFQLDEISATDASSPPTAPPAPGIQSLTAGAAGFTLNWAAVSGATLYEVKVGSTTLAPTTGTSMLISGLAPGNAYSITVRSKNAADIWSNPSTIWVADAIDATNRTQLKIHQPKR